MEKRMMTIKQELADDQREELETVLVIDEGSTPAYAKGQEMDASILDQNQEQDEENNPTERVVYMGNDDEVEIWADQSTQVGQDLGDDQQGFEEIEVPMTQWGSVERPTQEDMN